MNLKITIGGPLADAINALAAALQTSIIIESAQPKAPRKSKTPPAPAAQDEQPASVPEAESPEPAAVPPNITTYDALRNFVAPLLANPETKVIVAKAVKKFCTGNLKDIKTEDYPALVEALQGVGK